LFREPCSLNDLIHVWVSTLAGHIWRKPPHSMTLRSKSTMHPLGPDRGWIGRYTLSRMQEMRLPVAGRNVIPGTRSGSAWHRWSAHTRIHPEHVSTLSASRSESRLEPRLEIRADTRPNESQVKHPVSSGEGRGLVLQMVSAKTATALEATQVPNLRVALSALSTPATRCVGHTRRLTQRLMPHHQDLASESEHLPGAAIRARSPRSVLSPRATRNESQTPGKTT
jgi:hypothetical protein